MGFSKTPVVKEPEAPKAVESRLEKKETSAISAQVRGQVAMNAIKCGYDNASRLAPTMAAKPEDVKTTLHSLALEIAKKVEEYSFHD